MTDNKDIDNVLTEIAKNIISKKYIMTFVEYVEEEHKAKLSANIKSNPLSLNEILLLYSCYLLEKSITIDEVEQKEDSCSAPMDICVINNIYIQLSKIDIKYNNRDEWLINAIKIIYNIYNVIFSEAYDEDDINYNKLTDEQKEKLKEFDRDDKSENLFKNNFMLLDDLIYNISFSLMNPNSPTYDYIRKYNKYLLTNTFYSYFNTYWDTIDKLYDDKQLKENKDENTERDNDFDYRKISDNL